MPFDHDDLQDNEYPAPSAYNHRRYNFNRSTCRDDVFSWLLSAIVALLIGYIAFQIISDACNGTMY